MTILRYGVLGDPVADSRAEFTAQLLKTQSLYVSTENVVTAYRVLVHEGYFQVNEVELRYVPWGSNEEIHILVNKYGSCDGYPEGFCDTNDDFLLRLLDWDKETDKEWGHPDWMMDLVGELGGITPSTTIEGALIALQTIQKERRP